MLLELRIDALSMILTEKGRKERNGKTGLFSKHSEITQGRRIVKLPVEYTNLSVSQ